MDLVSLFVDFWRKEKSLVVQNLSFSALWPIHDVLVPALTGIVVAAVEARRPFGRPLCVLIGIIVAFNFAYILVTFHDGVFVPRLQAFARERMLTGMLQQDASLVQGREEDDLRTGEATSRMARVPDLAVSVLDNIKGWTVPYVVSFVVTSIYVTMLDKWIGLVLMAGVSVVLAIILSAPRWCRLAGQRQERALLAIHERTEDILRNATIVHSAGTAPAEIQSMGILERAYQACYMTTIKCIVRKRLAAVCVMALTMVAFAVQCRRKMALPKTSPDFMPVARFVTIFMVLIQMWGTLAWLMGLFNDIVMEYAALGVETQVKVNDKHGQVMSHELSGTVRNPTPTPLTKSTGTCARPAGRGGAAVVFRSVTYVVSTKTRPILDGVTFEVRPNERVAITGSIGSGKTTLLRMLMRFRAPTSGTIFLDGTDIGSVPLVALRRRVGYANQHPILFDRSIIDNLTYGCIRTTNLEGYARQLLQEVGLATAFGGDGSDLTMLVGKNGGRLSGGQRQIVQLVRTLLWDPEVLVLDEVTTSLDPVTKVSIMRLLRRMAQGRTVILVTHDPDLVQALAQRVVRLHRGKIAAAPTQKEIAAAPSQKERTSMLPTHSNYYYHY
jgi:ABC-type multidrug transport system fused ATPase/permease subunit